MTSGKILATVVGVAAAAILITQLMNQQRMRRNPSLKIGSWVVPYWRLSKKHLIHVNKLEKMFILD